jgi:hypothetical protein
VIVLQCVALDDLAQQSTSRYHRYLVYMPLLMHWIRCNLFVRNVHFLWRARIINPRIFLLIRNFADLVRKELRTQDPSLPMPHLEGNGHRLTAHGDMDGKAA